VSLSVTKGTKKKLRKTPPEREKFFDGKNILMHDDGGSKRFEEQQASASVANLER
jgi:hypothetical protein